MLFVFHLFKEKKSAAKVINKFIDSKCGYILFVLDAH
jgi:hypothetical protein